MKQVSDTMNGVEDDFSGVPKNPDPGLEFDGRMYPPRSDYTKETQEGGLRAGTRGHVIHAGADGSLRMESRKSGAVEFEKAGAGQEGQSASAERSRAQAQGAEAEAKDGTGTETGKAGTEGKTASAAPTTSSLLNRAQAGPPRPSAGQQSDPQPSQSQGRGAQGLQRPQPKGPDLGR